MGAQVPMAGLNRFGGGPYSGSAQMPGQGGGLLPYQSPGALPPPQVPQISIGSLIRPPTQSPYMNPQLPTPASIQQLYGLPTAPVQAPGQGDMGFLQQMLIASLMHPYGGGYGAAGSNDVQSG